MVSLSQRVASIRGVVIMNLAIMIALCWYYCKHVRPRLLGKRKQGYKYSLLDKMKDQQEYIDRLTTANDEDCKNVLRMRRDSFARLVDMLQDRGGLTRSKYVTAEEKVATFLAIIGHHTKQRVAKFCFRRSGQTISCYFREVLACVLRLHTVLIAQPVPVPATCVEEPWCHFKGCVGAVDGTYIKVLAPANVQAHYRNRKGFVSVNVLGACDQNMKFIYVLTGWEGSAGDGRVLRDAIHREDGFKIAKGTYYLVDAVYMNAPGFLPPFDSTRYHLQEWAESNRQPENPKEYFNLKHAGARNVIERCFGLLKKRCGILREASYFPLDIQNDIILACCLVHNFLRDVAADDLLEDEVPEPVVLHGDDDGVVVDAPPPPIESLQPDARWTAFRRNLAFMMYFGYRDRAAGRRVRRRIRI